MPLWAVPQPKILDGVEVPPWRSIGGRAFDPARDDDLDWLRRQYGQAQSEMPPPPEVPLLSRVVMWFGIPQLLEHPATAAFRKRWDRPFEEVIAQSAAEQRLVQKYDPALLADWPRLSELRSFPEFPAFMLDPAHDGEAPNVVAERTDLPHYRLADLLEPTEMRELAGQFDHCAADYRAKHGDDDDGPAYLCLHAIETAADWLRFWADRGHPSQGCWFIDTPFGRIQTVVG